MASILLRHRHSTLWFVFLFCFHFNTHGQQLLVKSNLTEDELKSFHKEENNFKHQRNTFLDYVTRGQELSILGKLQESNDYFEKAYWLLDSNKHKLPHTDRYGFAYEGFMVLYLKAANFFELQKPELALVECNRMRDWLNLDDFNLAENNFNDELFPHMLLGLLYENEGMPNDAYIEYQISYKLYQPSEEFFGRTSGQIIQAAILRTCLAAGLDEDFVSLQELFKLRNFKKPERTPGGTLTIICHLEVGPHRKDDDEPADFQTNANNQFGYLTSTSNGVGYKFETTFVTNPWRHQHWWTSLPRGIYYATVPLKMGRNEFRIELKDSLNNAKELRFEIEGTGKHLMQVINSITPVVSDRIKDSEADQYLHADSIQNDNRIKKIPGHKTRRWGPLIFLPEQPVNTSRPAYYMDIPGAGYWKNKETDGAKTNTFW